MDTIRILVAEDHALVREGTVALLQREPDLEIIAEAGDGEEAVRLAQDLRPDVVLMDIAMPKLNGIEATKEIKACCPKTAVLVLTAYDDDQYVFALLEAGAAGYLLKHVRGRDLGDAVRAVYAGESVLHPVIARKVIDRFASPDNHTEEKGVDQLTEREFEMLVFASKGLSNKEIAQDLSVSVRTVQAHLNTIFSKMQVGSRTEAVVQALQRGWITIEDTK
jgi:DNA-binding NarL/FixJ family response regulator